LALRIRLSHNRIVHEPQETIRHMYLRRIRSVALLSAMYLYVIIPACADSAFQVTADGTEYSLTVGPEQIADPEVSLLFLSPGSETIAVMVGIEGPPGLRGEVDGAKLPPGIAVSTEPLASSKLRESYLIRKAVGAKEAKRFEIEAGGSQTVVQFHYHLQKDACASDRSTQYLSRVLLDFRGVSPERFAQGVTIRFAIQEYRYQGSRIASIKPASDGKYRGEPILLMGTMQYGGEYVNIIQRGKRGIRLRRRVPVVKYVFHRGHTLSLARLRGVLRGVLRGGRATLELSNGGAVYSVCFALERRRQIANGYPL
jgi:hypothetical protein